MSRYDRREWQRPKGERTADPLWDEEIGLETARPARRKVAVDEQQGSLPPRPAEAAKLAETLPGRGE